MFEELLKNNQEAKPELTNVNIDGYELNITLLPHKNEQFLIHIDVNEQTFKGIVMKEGAFNGSIILAGGKIITISAKPELKMSGIKWKVKATYKGTEYKTIGALIKGFI